MAKKKLSAFHRMSLILGVTRSLFRQSKDPSLQLNYAGEPPRHHQAGIVLACCDIIYYRRFGHTLIETARRHSLHQHLHIHVYEPPESWPGEARQTVAQHSGLTLSWEDASRNPFRDGVNDHIYFEAGRFAVASRLVEETGSAVLVIDADGLIVRSLDEPFSSFSNDDIGLIFRRTLKVWRKVLAAAVLIQPSERGMEFARRVARSIDILLSEKPDFHVDQMVLYSAYVLFRLTSRRLRVRCLDKSFADWEFQPDSYIWSAKGRRKLDFSELVQRAADAEAGSGSAVSGAATTDPGNGPTATLQDGGPVVPRG